jgi:signal transduction histidine kinase
MEAEIQKFITHAADLMSEQRMAYHVTPEIVGGLRAHTISISPQTPMGWVIREFENSPELPGVLVFEQGEYRGMLSRRRVFQGLSRPYALELFVKHPASRFYSEFDICQTPIASRMRVEDAVRLALGRPGEQIYEPLVISHDGGKLSLLDMQVLLMAQSQLLVNANRVVSQLFDVSSVVSSSLDVNTVLDAILEYMTNTVPFDRCVVLFFNDTKVDIAALRGFPQEVDMRQIRRVVLENSIYETVRHSKQAMCIDDVLARKDWPHLPHVPPARTWLGIPLVHAGVVSGMLVVISLEPDAYSDQQIQLAQKIAEQAAIALRNAMLFKEVKVFNQQLESAIEERTRDLAETLRKLETANASKTDFLKSVAKQLEAPLRKIEGHKHFFITHAGQAADPFVQDVFNNLSDGINRLNEVVEKIQDVAAIESDEFNIQYESVEVIGLFQHLHEKFSATLRERRLILNLINLEKLPDLHGDFRLLSKVFSNLLENAIQHTHIGGKISVTGLHRINLDSQNTYSHVQITISDNGIGIDPAIQKKIFDKSFRYQASRNASSNDNYAGLGLAIVDGIVRAHNGQVWVESNGRDVILKPGSHFHVSLPAARGTGKSPTTLQVGVKL